MDFSDLRIFQFQIIRFICKNEPDFFGNAFSRKSEIINISDNLGVDFLLFQRDFTPQAKLEETFIYIIHKPIDFSIDFSYRLKTKF